MKVFPGETETQLQQQQTEFKECNLIINVWSADPLIIFQAENGGLVLKLESVVTVLGRKAYRETAGYEAEEQSSDS